MLSAPLPTRFYHEIPCFERTRAIHFGEIPSAVDEDDMQMCVVTMQRVSSKIWTVNGFIFSIPVSLDPSIATHFSCIQKDAAEKKGAIALLIMPHGFRAL